MSVNDDVLLVVVSNVVDDKSFIAHTRGEKKAFLLACHRDHQIFILIIRPKGQGGHLDIVWFTIRKRISTLYFWDTVNREEQPK